MISLQHIVWEDCPDIPQMYYMGQYNTKLGVTCV